MAGVLKKGIICAFGALSIALTCTAAAKDTAAIQRERAIAIQQVKSAWAAYINLLFTPGGIPALPNIPEIKNPPKLEANAPAGFRIIYGGNIFGYQSYVGQNFENGELHNSISINTTDNTGKVTCAGDAYASYSSKSTITDAIMTAKGDEVIIAKKRIGDGTFVATTYSINADFLVAVYNTVVPQIYDKENNLYKFDVANVDSILGNLQEAPLQCARSTELDNRPARGQPIHYLRQ